MKRQFCKVKHDPENGTYGDCLRASVATMLGHDVPHFFHDGCDGETGHNRLRKYLNKMDMQPFCFSFSGEISSQDILKHMKDQNSDVKYLLFCKCGGENHVVVCENDAVIHNPGWAPYPISGPTSENIWLIMVFVNAN